MTDAWTDRLSEYLDGELPEETAARLEAHLATCAACREVLSGLRRVVARARGLEDRPPTRDLWPAIEAHIREAPAAARPAVGGRAEGRREAARPGGVRRLALTLPQWAAAAAALVLLSAGTMFMVMAGPQGDPGAGPVATGDAAPALGPAAGPEAGLVGGFEGPSRGYDQAIAQLETILTEAGGALDTATVRRLRESLAKVDRAIEEARAALAEDPADPYLRQHLGETMRKKATLLRQTVTLVTSQS